MKASIVIPTRNGAACLGRCLEAVCAQLAPFAFDVLVVDSASDDGTREVAARFPVRTRVIDARDFDHGDTRNLGALLTDGDLIAFLVQDAWPASRGWLQTLASAFTEPAVAGAYSRVLPPPGASPRVRRAAAADLAGASARRVTQIGDREAWAQSSPLDRRVLADFNDVASCLRRSVWCQLPFARTLFGEDVLWARGALEAGHAIVFEPASTVFHGHEYDRVGVAARGRVDGCFNRAYFQRDNVPSRRAALRLAWRHAREERDDVPQPGRSRAFVFHWSRFDGFRAGGRTQERRPTPRLVPEARLRVLQVVHAFPPESVAGTEVFAVGLCRALARDHDVAVFHRSADPALADRSLHEAIDEGGLRRFKFVNHLNFAHLGESYRLPAAEAAFARVLSAVRPHVVHFHHLLHLSAGLPQLAAAAGVASIATLHDYWFRCPKVQLLRDERTPCDGPPPGALACAACLSGRVATVPRLSAVSRWTQPALALWSRHPHALTGGPRVRLLAHLAARPSALLAGLGACEVLVAPSRFLRDKALEAGLPAERLLVSDYGFEADALRAIPPLSPLSAPLRVGFLGSLVAHKGLGILAAAVARLGPESAVLHVFGDADSATAREIADQVRAFAPWTRFHGPVAPSRVAEALAAIDVLVVPSLWFENSPLVVHEAFLARRPVVASDLGALREFVLEGQGGVRFRAGDAADLARVIRRFLDEPGLGPALVTRAPEVKPMTECAAEMEIKYRQAIGLFRARSTDGTGAGAP